MAASKFQFRIFVVGMVIILSSLLAFSNASAETVTYHGAYKANRHIVYIGTNTDLYYDLTIVADDENAYGTVNVTGLGSFTYSGLITYYSEIPVTTDKGMTIVGSFSGTYNSVAQETTLNSTQYNSILTALNTINTTDQSIKNAVDSMKSSIMSVLNNIDDIIDTITWKPTNYVFNGSSSSLNGTYSDGNKSNPSVFFWFQDDVSTVIDTTDIMKFTVPYTILESRIDHLNIYVANEITPSERINYYVKYGNRKTEIYIYKFFTSSFPKNLKIEFVSNDIGNTVAYYYSTFSYSSGTLSSNDIEYWTLMNYFEQHYSSDKLDDTNEVLDPAVDNYVDTEDNLISDFDNSISNPNVKPSTNTYSDTSGWGTGFTSSIGFIGYIYNQLLQSSQGGNPFYMLINFSLMLGLALLIIGKRG